MPGSDQFGFRVSVIVPAYNATHTIGRAIDSCLSQTSLPKEIIVIDDCSTDSTVQIVKEKFRSARNDFANVNFVLISTPKNSGPASARNLGCEMAIGDYWAFLDADDYWHPEKIERCVRVAMTHPDSLFIGHAFSVSKLEPVESESPLRKYRPWQVLLRNPVVTPAMFLSKKIQARFNPDMKYAEDHDFIFRCSLESPILYLDQKLVALGRPSGSPGGLSARKLSMRLGEISMYISASRRIKWLIPFLPVLVAYSVAKHCYRFISSKFPI